MRILLIVLPALLGACGTRGPLVLPGPQPASAQSPAGANPAGANPAEATRQK